LPCENYESQYAHENTDFGKPNGGALEGGHPFLYGVFGSLELFLSRWLYWSEVFSEAGRSLLLTWLFLAISALAIVHDAFVLASSNSKIVSSKFLTPRGSCYCVERLNSGVALHAEADTLDWHLAKKREPGPDCGMCPFPVL